MDDFYDPSIRPLQGHIASTVFTPHVAVRRRHHIHNCRGSESFRLSIQRRPLSRRASRFLDATLVRLVAHKRLDTVVIGLRPKRIILFSRGLFDRLFYPPEVVNFARGATIICRVAETPSNKSLDASGGSVFRIIIGPARLE